MKKKKIIKKSYLTENQFQNASKISFVFGYERAWRVSVFGWRPSAAEPRVEPPPSREDKAPARALADKPRVSPAAMPCAQCLLRGYTAPVQAQVT